MKKKIIIAVFAGLLFSVISCNDKNGNIHSNNQKTEVMTTENNNNGSIFPLGSRGSSEWFTGEVYVQGLVSPDEMENLYSVGQVTFMPGARTNWHTHPIGQTLLVLEGRGWYQERGKPAQELVKGSVVPIPKDVEHWHGASADTKLVHIAISNIAGGSAVTWMNPVNEEEYNQLLQ